MRRALHLLLLLLMTIAANHSMQIHDLPPYQRRHGSMLTYRQVRECQPFHYGHETYERHQAHRSDGTENAEPADVRTFASTFSGSLPRVVKGHYALVSDPLRTTTVLEPISDGGCSQNLRGTVATSAARRKCVIAMNAGFFNTSSGTCLGNVISDGRLVQRSHVQNAQFGIEKNGTILIGYISDEHLASASKEFTQLLSGVIWLLRNGENYVNHSIASECPDSQETGSFQRFASVRSARTAVGHDKEGRLILLHVEGKTDQEGVNLWELADVMKYFGAVNAINTDGGGSATFVWNNVVVNYPSDDCHDQNDLKCARNVSTVFCIHDPECEDDCGPHGECRRGRCVCTEPWSGATCSELPCHFDNCTAHGQCTEQGCACNQGWFGRTCNTSCHTSTESLMLCQTGDTSSTENCSQHFEAICKSTCCSSELLGNQQALVKLQHEQYILWWSATFVSTCLAIVGIVTSAVLLHSRYKHKRCNSSRSRKWLPYGGDAFEDSSSDEEGAMMLQQHK